MLRKNLSDQFLEMRSPMSYINLSIFINSKYTNIDLHIENIARENTFDVTDLYYNM